MPINSIRIESDYTTDLQGEAPEGTTLEVLDLTHAAEHRLGLDQFQTQLTIGADGKFSLPLSQFKEGNYVQLAAKDANNVVQSLLRIRIDAAGVSDAHNAPFVGRRLAMYDAGGGKAVVTQNDALRPLSEPFAKVKVTNQRTGETIVVQLDEQGLMPEETLINAITGDAITFAVTDGVNNTDFAVSDPLSYKVVGKVARVGDLPDPAPLANAIDSKGRSKIGMRPFLGQAYVDGVSEDDLLQRAIGDCYLPAALGSIARLQPEAITRMLRQQDDGSYVCTFYELDWQTGTYKQRAFKLDTDLYVNAAEQPVYGGAPDLTVDNMELWFPLIEKAYAEWAGSYEAIVGGQTARVFEAVLGKKSRNVYLNDPTQAGVLWQQVQRCIDAKLPCAFSTNDDIEFYKETGLHPNHAYSVLGYREVNGVREVEIRNPWGYDEVGYDGKDDGEFWMPVEEAARLFESFTGVR